MSFLICSPDPKVGGSNPLRHATQFSTFISELDPPASQPSATTKGAKGNQKPPFSATITKGDTKGAHPDLGPRGKIWLTILEQDMHCAAASKSLIMSYDNYRINK